MIPDAVKALDDEWNKLANRNTCPLDFVREKQDVKNQASKKNEEAHSGELMSLCFLKGAELDVKFQKYKGRVVFRGDSVRDQHDYLA
eukprot:5699395-Karenia_brevis.AAC.1